MKTLFYTSATIYAISIPFLFLDQSTEIVTKFVSVIIYSFFGYKLYESAKNYPDISKTRKYTMLILSIVSIITIFASILLVFFTN